MEQKEYDTLMPQIDKLDEQITQINADMQANGDDYGKLAELQKQLDEANAKQDELMNRYLELDEYVN
jgi:ATP-binding cassette subfamily F protein uup